jgi:hypothetical protein
LLAEAGWVSGQIGLGGLLAAYYEGNRMAETKRMDLSAKLHVAGMSATVLAMGTGFATYGHANPVITGPGLNVNIADNSYPLDLDNDGNPDFALVNYPISGVLNIAFGYGVNAIEGINITPADQDYSSQFNKAYANNAGETVGPGNPFVPKFATLQVNNGTTAYGYWPEGQQKFLGLRFDIQDQTGGDPTTHYGFAGITLAEGGLAMNLDCYGYESDADTEIMKSCATSVPEPGSLLLLAAGAVPLLAIRRRRVRH